MARVFLLPTSRAGSSRVIVAVLLVALVRFSSSPFCVTATTSNERGPNEGYGGKKKTKQKKTKKGGGGSKKKEKLSSSLPKPHSTTAICQDGRQRGGE